MNIGARLETIGKYVPENCVLADIGTDHAYLPVWLLKNNKISFAVAGDIADGPCLAAKNTVAMYGLKDKVAVRKGSGLKVLDVNEVKCIAIAGMGATTIISILADDMQIAVSAERLILQPMAGAPILRKWLCENGWRLVAEDLAEDGKHLYEIIVAERGVSDDYTAAELEIGPILLKNGHSLLKKQIEKQLHSYKMLLNSMGKSECAMQSKKFKEAECLLKQMEVLADDCNSK